MLHAASLGFAGIVQALIAAGADVNAAGSAGLTAVAAAKAANCSIVEHALVAAGADVVGVDALIDARSGRCGGLNAEFYAFIAPATSFCAALSGNEVEGATTKGSKVTACLDKPKFGGQGRIKKRCQGRMPSAPQPSASSDPAPRATSAPAIQADLCLPC